MGDDESNAREATKEDLWVMELGAEKSRVSESSIAPRSVPLGPDFVVLSGSGLSSSSAMAMVGSGDIAI